MNINQLEYLRELIHAGSFTLAAEGLGISQPALSTQIAALERELQMELVNRSAKPIRLTPDGERVFELAAEILHRIDALRELPELLSEAVEGTLRLGIIPTLSPYLVPMILDPLNRDYPGMKLRVEELLTEEIVHRLRTGHLDAGLISTPVQIKSIRFRPLFYERFYLYLSERDPLFSRTEIRVEELQRDRLWFLREGNCFTNQVEAICDRAGRSPKGNRLHYFSNSIESLRRFVERHHGATFIPELATIQVSPEYEDMIKPLSVRKPVREISLVYQSEFAKRRLLEAFVSVTLAELPPHMKERPEDWIVDTDIALD